MRLLGLVRKSGRPRITETTRWRGDAYYSCHCRVSQALGDHRHGYHPRAMKPALLASDGACGRLSSAQDDPTVVCWSQGEGCGQSRRLLRFSRCSRSIEPVPEHGLAKPTPNVGRDSRHLVPAGGRRALRARSSQTERAGVAASHYRRRAGSRRPRCSFRGWSPRTTRASKPPTRPSSATRSRRRSSICAPASC